MPLFFGDIEFPVKRADCAQHTTQVRKIKRFGRRSFTKTVHTQYAHTRCAGFPNTGPRLGYVYIYGVSSVYLRHNSTTVWYNDKRKWNTNLQLTRTFINRAHIHICDNVDDKRKIPIYINKNARGGGRTDTKKNHYRMTAKKIGFCFNNEKNRMYEVGQQKEYQRERWRTFVQKSDVFQVLESS